MLKIDFRDLKRIQSQHLIVTTSMIKQKVKRTKYMQQAVIMLLAKHRRKDGEKSSFYIK